MEQVKAVKMDRLRGGKNYIFRIKMVLRVFLATIILITLSVGGFAQSVITKVEMKFVSPLIQTVVSVDCNRFEEVFKEKIRVYNFNEREVSTLIDYLRNLKPTNKGSQPDTRAQFFITKSDGSIDIMCYDGGYNLSKKDEVYKLGKQFAFFLNGIISKNTGKKI